MAFVGVNMGSSRKISDEVALITADGKLMGGPETCSLCRKVEELECQGFKKIVIDLSGVQWANSTAIGALIKSYLQARDRGCDLCFTSLSERVKYYMTITKLISVIPTFETLDDALMATSIHSGHPC